jgi:hypothetical protein
VVKDILQEAGIQARAVRFLKPPAGTYAVYLDDTETDGPDGRPCIITHSYTIELYEPAPDDAAEAAIENALTARGIHWTKQARYWIQSEQLYQVVYDFTNITKRRI